MNAAVTATPDQGARAEAIAREHAQITRRALEFAAAHSETLSALPGGPLIDLAAS
jgi:hypothetical protein